MLTRVALVGHSSVLNSQDRRGDLSLFRQELDSTPDTHHDVVAWDDPEVKWSSYTHLLLTYLLRYVEYLDEFLSWLTALERRGLSDRLYNRVHVARWNCNKRYLKELEAKGVPVPATMWLATEGGAEAVEASLAALATGGTSELVVKNVVDAGGRSAWKCRLPMSPEEKTTLTRQVAGSQHGVMVQRFLPGVVAQGEWSLVYFDGRLSHAVIKTPRGGGEFRVQERHGGAFEPVPLGDVPECLFRAGERVLAKVERAVYARIDMVLDQGEPVVMEVEMLDPFLFLTHREQARRLKYALLGSRKTAETTL